jgi:hypothetical protein
MEDRKVKVILEDINSQFRTFGEGLAGANKKLDATMEMVAKNTEDIEVIKIDQKLMRDDLKQNTKDIEVIKVDQKLMKDDIKQNTADIKEMKVMISKNTDDISKNTDDVEIIKSDIGFIKNELKKFIRVEEFEALEKRVNLIEKKLARI